MPNSELQYNEGNRNARLRSATIQQRDLRRDCFAAAAELRRENAEIPAWLNESLDPEMYFLSSVTGNETLSWFGR